MQSQHGVTLIELLVVVAAMSLVLTVTVVYSVPWMAKETMRGAVQEVRSFFQLAQIEAVSRNRDCRFEVDEDASMMRVWDGMGTDDNTDDELLHDRALPASVLFARPDSGDTITLSQIGSTSRYQTIFTPNGVVAAGTGQVFLHGGEQFGTIQVYAAGGTEVLYWDGSAWADGS